jgi:DNA repair exonuclease SbcCD ATPase subunit
VRVIKAEVKNFSSYGDLSFNFSNQGLTLIQGATGSGKSTLCDIVPWVLFGITAKGGKVDEVVSWGSKEQTFGSVVLSLNGEFFIVTRARNPNDLFFGYGENALLRGKDLNDTQKLINAKLGIDADLYLSGAYFHEFSRTAAFFTATAKARREICEQIVDLALPERLKLSLSAKEKELKQKEVTLASSLDQAAAALRVLTSSCTRVIGQQTAWQAQRGLRIEGLQSKARNFDKELQAELDQLRKYAEEFEAEREKDIAAMQAEMENPKCGSCGEPLKDPSKKRKILREHISARFSDTNRYLAQFERAQQRTNHYTQQVEEAITEENPYDAEVDELREEVQKTKLEAKAFDKLKTQVAGEKQEVQILLDVIQDFRGALITRTIQELQNTTNEYLAKYFDAEIRVELSIADADKIETLIHKDGNECVYTQLSKGQRQLLKLSFGLAVMQAVKNHHGVTFNAVFLDEALDGLDDRFKVKAYSLLEALSTSYESVFCVEHSTELKALFSNQIEVELVNGKSVLRG